MPKALSNWNDVSPPPRLRTTTVWDIEKVYVFASVSASGCAHVLRQVKELKACESPQSAGAQK